MGCSVWRIIQKEGVVFWRVAYIDPGGGSSTLFWHDTWIPGHCLKDDFPRVAASSSYPNGSLSFWMGFMMNDRWQLPSRWSLHGGAAREEAKLQDLLASIPTDRVVSSHGQLVWPLTSSNLFFVRSLVSHLVDKKFQGLPCFPANRVWLSWIPPKVCCFMWLSCLDRISTIDNLRKKGIIMPKCCHLYWEDEESVDHIFLHCRFVSVVWNIVLGVLLSTFPLPKSLCDLFISEVGGRGDDQQRLFGNTVVHSVCWFVWLERNSRIFRDRSTTP
ncbi:hypothetical protein LINGRAPRIM_LOCUS1191 [Linum grandiflorum]